MASSDVREAKKGKRTLPADRTLPCRIYDAFHFFAKRTSFILGTPWSFVLALLVIVVWGVTGPIFHFSDTWQLIINTGTTIVTFLMVFLLQNTQNRDSKNTQLKLDEIIRALKGARNDLLDLDHLSEDDLQRLEDEFQQLSDRASSARTARKHRPAKTKT
jgi:low affinity Fe/Cu permease